MKEKIQKYLAGEREGFSLVELIIVIAIMAILIGVVALAVLPNIEKSKESKDFAVLDSICSALNAAVASTQASGIGAFEFTDNYSGTDKVQLALKENLGSGAKTLTSTVAQGQKICCYYNTNTGVIKVYAAAAAAGSTDPTPGTGVSCKYNDQKELAVSN